MNSYSILLWKWVILKTINLWQLIWLIFVLFLPNKKTRCCSCLKKYFWIISRNIVMTLCWLIFLCFSLWHKTLVASSHNRLLPITSHFSFKKWMLFCPWWQSITPARNEYFSFLKPCDSVQNQICSFSENQIFWM